MTVPVLIIHGGAGSAFKTARRRSEVCRKISRILKAAYAKLVDTDSMEAVTYAVKLLEDDPAFNAGTGASLQADGKARLTASVMDGPNACFAAVINLERIKNPVLVARALLNEEFRLLCGEGAFRFAKKLGMKPADVRTSQSIQRWRKSKEKKYDTVGACALDRFGNLASATSTGGRGNETVGRVSDSGMPVANFADEICAVSASGIGEHIIEEGLAIKIATRVRDGMTLREAFDRTFKEVRLRNRKMGAIGLDFKGNVAHSASTESWAFGWQKGKKVVVF